MQSHTKTLKYELLNVMMQLCYWISLFTKYTVSRLQTRTVCFLPENERLIVYIYVWQLWTNNMSRIKCSRKIWCHFRWFLWSLLFINQFIIQHQFVCLPHTVLCLIVFQVDIDQTPNAHRRGHITYEHTTRLVCCKSSIPESSIIFNVILWEGRMLCTAIYVRM